LVADECRISIEPNPYYTWHQKGKTPVKKQKLNIHQSKVIYGALSLKQDRIISYQTLRQNGIETAKFLDKIREFKEYFYSDSKESVLVLWDNSGSHKNQNVKDWLKNNPKMVELDHFPSYSPELNPQEKVWKKLKKHINYLRSTATLTEIMTEAMKFLKK
jgi:nanoRNase/pAp phosphatase (c-di-AMP/oligoRNAs hydrolase)